MILIRRLAWPPHGPWFSTLSLVFGPLCIAWLSHVQLTIEKPEFYFLLRQRLNELGGYHMCNKIFKEQ